jgi:hypothetical protein
VVDRQVGATGLLAGGAIAVYEVPDAHVVRTVVREEQTVGSLVGVLEQVVLQHGEERTAVVRGRPGCRFASLGADETDVLGTGSPG